MTGTEYTIEHLGRTCQYLEAQVAERDIALEQAAERITRVEAELEAERTR